MLQTPTKRTAITPSSAQHTRSFSFSPSSSTSTTNMSPGNGHPLNNHLMSPNRGGSNTPNGNSGNGNTRLSLPLPSSQRLTLFAAVATVVFVIVGFISFQHSHTTSMNNPTLSPAATNVPSHSGIIHQLAGRNLAAEQSATNTNTITNSNGNGNGTPALPIESDIDGEPGSSMTAPSTSITDEPIDSETSTSSSSSSIVGSDTADEIPSLPPTHYAPVMDDGNPHPYTSPVIRRQSQSRLPFRIYVYDLPTRFHSDLYTKECLDSLFGTEIKIHQYFLSSELRTMDPSEADFFYVPLYASCLIFRNFDHFTAYRKLFQEAITLVSQEYVWWNRSNGMDHVWTLAHDFAGCLAWLDNWDHVYYKEMRHSIFISHLGDLAMGCFSPTKDIVIPTMSTNNYVYRWGLGGANTTITLPDQSQRKIFIHFRGTVKWKHSNSFPSLGIKRGPSETYSRGVRAKIKEYYERDPLFYIQEGGSVNYHMELTQSVFCLAPLGFASWSGRMFDSIMMGCIPVIISDGLVAPYEDLLDYRTFAIKIAEKDVPLIRDILLAVPKEEIRAKQAVLAQMWKAVSWQSPPQPGDAYDYLVQSLASKVRRYKPIGPVVFSTAMNATQHAIVRVERAVQGERLPGEAAPVTPPPHARLKIFVYDLPPEYNTDLLGRKRRHNVGMVEQEAAFHRLMLSSPLRVMDPEQANMFYVPVYPVAYCSHKKESCTDARDGPHCVGCSPGRELTISAYNYINKNYPYWERYNGGDHVWLQSYNYGACNTRFGRTADMVGFPLEIMNSTIISHLGDRGANPGGCFRLSNDVVIPPYMPMDYAPLEPTWDGGGRRKYLAYFRGTLKLGDIAEPRQRLIAMFKKMANTLVTDERVPEKQFINEMMMSTFCICPRSLTLWTHRLVQSILAGCIPVLIDDGSAVYPFESMLDYRTFTVRASPERLTPLVETLTKMTDAELIAKQRALYDARSLFLFPNNGTRTWNAVLDQVALRLERKQKELMLPPTVNAVVDDGSPYSFEVDIVFTWSNTNDTKYTSVYNKHGPPSSLPYNTRHDPGHLRYALRSIDMFAPWVRNIYIVVCCCMHPEWLKTDSGKVKLVSHDSLFPDEYQQYLPTFNPFAVDAHVDRVPGLSEQFILMKDNQFFGRHVFKSDFFTREGAARVVLGEDWNTLMTGVLSPSLLSIHNSAYEYSHKLLNDLYAWQKTRKRLNLQPLGLTRQAYKSLHHWYKKEVQATVQMRYPLPGPDQQPSVVPQFLVLYMAFRGSGFLRVSHRDQVSSIVEKLTKDVAKNAVRLQSLAKWQQKLMCIVNTLENDDSSDRSAEVVASQLRNFLLSQYPVAAPWETAHDELVNRLLPPIDTPPSPSVNVAIPTTTVSSPSPPPTPLVHAALPSSKVITKVSSMVERAAAAAAAANVNGTPAPAATPLAVGERRTAVRA